MSDDLREQAKGPLHTALHDLGPHIIGLSVDGCHCNLITEAALDALAPTFADLAERDADLAEIRELVDEPCDDPECFSHDLPVVQVVRALRNEWGRLQPVAEKVQAMVTAWRESFDRAVLEGAEMDLLAAWETYEKQTGGQSAVVSATAVVSAHVAPNPQADSVMADTPAPGRKAACPQCGLEPIADGYSVCEVCAFAPGRGAA